MSKSLARRKTISLTVQSRSNCATTKTEAVAFCYFISLGGRKGPPVGATYTRGKCMGHPKVSQTGGVGPYRLWKRLLTPPAKKVTQEGIVCVITLSHPCLVQIHIPSSSRSSESQSSSSISRASAAVSSFGFSFSRVLRRGSLEMSYKETS